MPAVFYNKDKLKAIISPRIATKKKYFYSFSIFYFFLNLLKTQGYFGTNQLSHWVSDIANLSKGEQII